MTSKPTRRSFFGHAGAALAAPLTVTTAAAAEPNDDVAARLAALEDENAIRALLSELLLDPRRLELDTAVRSIAADRNETIAVAADGTATVLVACTVETATPIESCGTLVDMARLQGDGLLKRSERRMLTSTFVKRNGTWQIEDTELTA